MKVNSKTIVGMILALVFIMVLFAMLPSILPQVILNVNTLFDSSNLANATLVGAGPASFAANISTYLGWFWIIGPFVLVIGVILALFLKKGRR